MRIDFTFVPSAFAATEPAAQPQSFYFDPQRSDATLAEIDDSVFGGLIVDDAGGLLTNIDLAGHAALATSGLRVALTHWAGLMSPTSAARQLAALDHISAGRLALRILVDGVAEEEGGTLDRHVNAWRRTDEYLVLLKRLLANDQPFDYVGPFYRIHDGFVPKKGPSGFAIPIRMTGRSGTALEIAGRHADVFELPAGRPTETRQLIERVRNAAAQRGRADKVRFALPVRLGQPGQPKRGAPDAIALPDADHEAVSLLTAYVSAGVSEFMVTGTNEATLIRAFSEHVAGPVRDSVTRRDAPLPPYPRNVAWLARGRRA